MEEHKQVFDSCSLIWRDAETKSDWYEHEPRFRRTISEEDLKLEMKIRIPKLKCKRCGHEWIPKIEDVKQCPKCKSARWNEYKE